MPPLAASRAFPSPTRLPTSKDLRCTPPAGLCCVPDNLICISAPGSNRKTSRHLVLQNPHHPSGSRTSHCHSHGRRYRAKPNRLLRCYSRRYAARIFSPGGIATPHLSRFLALFTWPSGLCGPASRRWVTDISKQGRSWGGSRWSCSRISCPRLQRIFDSSAQARRRTTGGSRRATRAANSIAL
jgi:hypothetical protein